MDKRICKVCKVIKDRVPDGTFLSPKNKKWRDSDGLLWNGSVCGVCNQERLKNHMKSKRMKDNLSELFEKKLDDLGIKK